jgi:hypothetical protein
MQFNAAGFRNEARKVLIFQGFRSPLGSAKEPFKEIPAINSLLRKRWLCGSLLAEKRPTERPTARQ